MLDLFGTRPHGPLGGDRFSRPRGVGVGRIGRPAAIALVCVLSLVAGSGPDLLGWRINQLAGELAWSVMAWEARHGPEGAALVLAQAFRPPVTDDVDREIGRYIQSGPADAAPPRTVVLASAVASYLRAEGAPALGSLVFPPVAFTLADPPLALVVSPRSEIRLRYAVLVRGGTTLAAAQELERQVERLDISALVMRIGGIATYPTLVPADTPPARAIETIAHEWTHTALFFSPLGRAYGTSPAALAINETAADIVGAEVAAHFATRSGQPAVERSSDGDTFLRDRLRSIRRRVDELLASGDIAGAESFMEAERRTLVERGYAIRRLNQAYFAFHGSYAEGPSATTEILDSLRSLRRQSPSLGEFLARVGQITSVADLRGALGVPSSPPRESDPLSGVVRHGQAEEEANRSVLPPAEPEIAAREFSQRLAHEGTSGECHAGGAQGLGLQRGVAALPGYELRPGGVIQVQEVLDEVSSRPVKDDRLVDGAGLVIAGLVPTQEPQLVVGRPTPASD